MKTGFSADGYIVDQDCFSAYPYRTVTSDWNGCGWMAAYDLRHALGQTADFDTVRREMDGMFLLRVPGPTTMRVMLRYLRRCVPDLTVVLGRAAALSAAPRARAGILRYTESGVPHFVAFVRLADGRCRFFNVADGLEDYVCGMEQFLLTRCARGTVKAMLVF